MSHAYRPEIDGLRAVAVLAVVVFHAVPEWLPGGFVGVDVFFVISGYLITTLLVDEHAASGRIGIAAFYARRARRLLPALWLVLVATLLLSAILLAPANRQFHQVADSALASLAFLANLYFQQTTQGYFAGHNDTLPLLHLWSLAVEEQFYVVYPLLLWVALRRSVTTARIVVAVTALASLVLAEAWVSTSPALAFFQMPSRFWELSAGALVALSASRAWSRGARVAVMSGGLAVVAFSVVATGDMTFPGFGALPAVVGATLVVLGVHHTAAEAPPTWAGRWLRARAVVGLGLVSYPLYLWHWPLLALDRAVNLDPTPVAWRLGLCGLALLLAWGTWRFVEGPVRRRLRWPAGRVLLAAACCSVAVAAVPLALQPLQQVPAELATLVERTRADRPADMARCHLSLGQRVDALRDCVHGDGEPSIALWGDSHALAWQPFVWRIADRRTATARAMTLDACPPLVDHRVEHRAAPRHGEACLRFNELALAELRARDYRLVVIASRWNGVVDAASDPATVESALRRTLDALATVPEVWLMLPPPELRHAAPDCLASGREWQCARDRAEADAMSARAQALAARVARGRHNVRLVDPTAFFCDARQCPVRRDGYALFWDDDHVSATASAAFAEALWAHPDRYFVDGARPATPTRTSE